MNIEDLRALAHQVRQPRPWDPRYESSCAQKLADERRLLRHFVDALAEGRYEGAADEGARAVLAAVASWE